MNESEIIESVKQYVGNYLYPNNKYNRWTIGITQNKEERKAYHAREHNVDEWKAWEADNLKIARDVEYYFRHGITDNMKGGVGGDMIHTKTTWVYVF